MAMFLLGAGALGALFLLSITLVNLWGYSQLEAALALLPIGACGMIMWPIVGKGADHLAPYRLAMPALLSMALGMLWFSFLPVDLRGPARLPHRAARDHPLRARRRDGVPGDQRRRDGRRDRPRAGRRLRRHQHLAPDRRRLRDRAPDRRLHDDGRLVPRRASVDPIEDKAYVWAIPNPVAHGLVGAEPRRVRGRDPAPRARAGRLRPLAAARERRHRARRDRLGVPHRGAADAAGAAVRAAADAHARGGPRDRDESDGGGESGGSRRGRRRPSRRSRARAPPWRRRAAPVRRPATPRPPRAPRR